MFIIFHENNFDGSQKRVWCFHVHFECVKLAHQNSPIWEIVCTIQKCVSLSSRFHTKNRCISPFRILTKNYRLKSKATNNCFSFVRNAHWDIIRLAIVMVHALFGRYGFLDNFYSLNATILIQYYIWGMLRSCFSNWANFKTWWIHDIKMFNYKLD